MRRLREQWQEARNTKRSAARGWKVPSCVFLGPETVATATKRVNQLRLVAFGDFAAQRRHKCIQRVLLDILVQSPNGIENGGTGHYFASVAHEKFEHAVFGRRQRDLSFSARDF